MFSASFAQKVSCQFLACNEVGNSGETGEISWIISQTTILFLMEFRIDTERARSETPKRRKQRKWQEPFYHHIQWFPLFPLFPRFRPGLRKVSQNLCQFWIFYSTFLWGGFLQQSMCIFWFFRVHRACSEWFDQTTSAKMNVISRVPNKQGGAK